MRSGRGKCPQCKEIIVVDLDAQEIRCPLCNALLKQSKKTVAEVRAEEEARIAAAEARERALRGEPEATPVQPEPAVETPVEEPAVEVPAEETVVETPAQEVVAETPAEEETPAAETVDEIGMTDEELAALDDVLPTDAEEAVAAEEPAAEVVDEIGMTDEELAAMDEALPEESADAAPAEDAREADVDIPVADEPIEVAPAEDDQDLAVTGSVSDEEDIAAADIAPAEEEESEPSDEDTAGSLGSTHVIPDEGAEEEPQIEIEDEPMEGAASPAPAEASEAEADIAEEIPVEAVEPAEESAIEIAEPEESVEIPVEEAPAEDIPVETAPAEEEIPVEEVPVEEEIPVAEVEESPADSAAYTDEDMAFAASLSDGIAANDGGEKEGKKVGYVAPIVNTAIPASDRGDKSDARAKKGAAPEGERKMSGAIYKKPVAVIMMILALIGAAVSLLFINLDVFGYVSESVELKVVELITKLPETIVNMNLVIFGGIIVLISILGLTGKRGKPGFFFTLLVGLVILAKNLFGGAAPVIEVEAIANILAEYAEYVEYAIYGLLFIGALAFAISIGSGKEELEISGGTVILPILYILVAVGAYVALVALPFVTSFEITAEYIKYAIYGIVGLSILLTLIGVHSATASRGANAWLLFASAVIVALLFAADVVLDKVVTSKGGEINAQVRAIVTTVTPSILFFPLIGYTISDMRN